MFREMLPTEGALRDKVTGKMVRVSAHVQRYPKDFVGALVSYARELANRGLGRTRRLLSHCLMGEAAPDTGEPEAPLPPGAPGESDTPPTSKSGPQEPSSHADRRITEQVYTGLGHPPNKTLVRVLKYGRARPEFVRAAATWRCASCEIRKRPDKPRPSQPPMTYEVNDIVGLDIVCS